MEKIILCPCNGVGKPVASILRYVVMLLKQKMGDDLELINSVEAAAYPLELKKRNLSAPVVILDGCGERCASNIFLRNNMANYYTIYIPRMLADNKLSMAGIERDDIGQKGRIVGDKLAGILEAVLKKIILSSTDKYQQPNTCLSLVINPQKERNL